MFEIATRKKYRFPYKGQIGVEDLWDLSRSQLDQVYKELSKEVKNASEDSLMSASKVDEDLDNKIKIVKYIFDWKTLDAAAKKDAAEKREKKRKIMEIIAQKQDESLQNMSEDDLKALLADLG